MIRWVEKADEVSIHIQSIEWLGILSYIVFYNLEGMDLTHGGLDLVVVAQIGLDLSL